MEKIFFHHIFVPYLVMGNSEVSHFATNNLNLHRLLNQAKHSLPTSTCREHKSYIINIKLRKI